MKTEEAHTEQLQWRICLQAVTRRDIMLPFIITCQSSDSLETACPCIILYLSLLVPALALAGAWHVSNL